jgi:Fur family transcriptional regulator, ferric uptake regulator
LPLLEQKSKKDSYPRLTNLNNFHLIEIVNPLIEEKLYAYIKAKGLRKTSQRDTLVKIIFEKDEHFTAEELFERVKQTNSDASRATVYRTISMLVDAKLLHEIDLGDDVKTYDPNFTDRPSHNHMICVDCGKVLEFEDGNIEILNDCLTRRMGFRPVSQSIRIEATCNTLRSKGMCKNLIQSRIESKRLRKR